MDKTTQDNLCKGLRAIGIPREMAHQILNTILKWDRCNGPEWTNARIKDLRQWYETYLAGNPVPPKWFKHDRSNMPLGIWKQVFNLPTAKALGVLSSNTVYYEKSLSVAQKKKFLKGLAGNGLQSEANLRWLLQEASLLDSNEGYIDIRMLPFKRMPKIPNVTIFDMNGSIPVHDSHRSARVGGSTAEALKALEESWESVPNVTFNFYLSQGLEGQMPPAVIGNDYALELNKEHSSYVGRVSVLQQAQLKARVVGNPNRILNNSLEPLKQLYMSFLKDLKTDVTFEQEEGIRWVQSQLNAGYTLAGSDLTSASDLLDIDLSLFLVDQIFGFHRIEGYEEFSKYFKEVCRSKWFCKELNTDVKWEQGSVLGTGPSFGLMAITNNCAALVAWKLAHDHHEIDPDLKPFDCWRVLGDDIIMLAPLERYYNLVIESLGGEINHSKTLTSNRVAEFAGHVITPCADYLKAINYVEPSDNSFMDIMKQLGDQAKYLLKPKQRKCYELLKEVPGILVPGHWMQDSYGVPLSDRYQWYLEEVQPTLRKEEPDLQQVELGSLMLKAQLDAEASGLLQSMTGKEFATPFFEEDYLSSMVTPVFRRNGDPRLTNGKTLTDTLYEHVSKGDITPFNKWLSNNQPDPTSNEEVKVRDENDVAALQPRKSILSVSESNKLIKMKGALGLSEAQYQACRCSKEEFGRVEIIYDSSLQSSNEMSERTESQVTELDFDIDDIER